MPEPSSVRLFSIPLAKFEAKSGSHVLSFFTREKGQVRAVVRTSGGKKKPNAPVLPLFSTYELLFREPREEGGLHELKERETFTGRPNLNAGTPLEPWAAASVLSELLLRTTQNEDPHPYLFGMLDKALDCLEEGQSPVVLLAAFLVKFLEHMGYRPRWEVPGDFNQGGKDWVFTPARGGLYTRGELHGLNRDDPATPIGRATPVTAEEIGTIHQFRLSTFEALPAEQREIDAAKKWVPLLGEYVEYHLETRLKSLGFWAEIQP